MIKLLCEAIKREAQSIIDYSEDIEKLLTSPLYKKEADILDDNRVDNVLHLQTLITDLAESFFDKEINENERSSGPDEGTTV